MVQVTDNNRHERHDQQRGREHQPTRDLSVCASTPSSGAVCARARRGRACGLNPGIVRRKTSGRTVANAPVPPRWSSELSNPPRSMAYGFTRLSRCVAIPGSTEYGILAVQDLVHALEDDRRAFLVVRSRYRDGPASPAPTPAICGSSHGLTLDCGELGHCRDRRGRCCCRSRRTSARPGSSGTAPARSAAPDVLRVLRHAHLPAADGSDGRAIAAVRQNVTSTFPLMLEPCAARSRTASCAGKAALPASNASSDSVSWYVVTPRAVMSRPSWLCKSGSPLPSGSDGDFPTVDELSPAARRSH